MVRLTPPWKSRKHLRTMPYRNSLSKPSKTGRFRRGLCSVRLTVFSISGRFRGILRVLGDRHRPQDHVRRKSPLRSWAT
jgi:hypothetical protein